MKDLYGKKEKHEHKFSNILKGCILAIIMLAPFFAILSKIFYVSANKNAKDSYYGETINEEQILTPTQINNNTRYLLYWDNLTNYTESPAPRLYVTNFSIENKGTMPDTTYNTIMSFKDYVTGMVITNYAGTPNIQFLGEGTQTINLTSTHWVFSLNYVGKQNNFDINNLRYIEYNKYSYLDNVFYYAINQSKDEVILNWTKDTPIYTAINAMNTGLGLSSNHILTYLLTYWSIILAIYIVFDIIIFAFTKITHYLQ